MRYFSSLARVSIRTQNSPKRDDSYSSLFLSITGIAVAMVCAQRGYPCVICMAEPFSIERRKIMRMLGAKVIVTPKGGKGTGMVKKAEELAEKHGWFLTSQFENEANWKFHEKTTGQEILRDFSGKNLTHFVTGYGTGGTFHGVAKALKAKRPDVKICLLEPSAAPLLASGTKTERKPSGAPVGSHPAFTPHPVQGWTPDFIPEVLDRDIADHVVTVNEDESMACARRLGQEEGIFVGISAGGTLSASLKIAEQAEPGSVIVTMLADTAERYISTPLFADINEGSDDDWLDQQS